MVKSILCRKKDGDWYIYPQFLAHENFNNVQKKAQKGCKIFKPTIHNVLSTGTNIVKIWLSLCLIRCVRFERHCGKMYSRHLFFLRWIAFDCTHEEKINFEGFTENDQPQPFEV